MHHTNADLADLQELRNRTNGNRHGPTPTDVCKRNQHGRDVAARLEKKFGLGDDPRRRRLLYSRLEREVEQFGDVVYKTIQDVVLGASYADKPGRWFSRGVVARLREQGYLLNDQSNEW